MPALSPPAASGADLSTTERGLSIGLGVALLSLGRGRGRPLWLLLATPALLLIARGARGTCPLYRHLGGDGVAYSPFDKKFRAYVLTSIAKPIDEVEAALRDPLTISACCRSLNRLLQLRRGRALATTFWPGLQRLPDEGPRLLHGTHGEGELLIELTPTHDAQGTELRLLLRYHPRFGLFGRLLQASPTASLQADLDRLRQQLETGVITNARGPRGAARRSLMQVVDELAERKLA